MPYLLSDYTTLQVGGPAARLAETDRLDEAWAQVSQAQQEGLPLLILGGGSNLLVADEGFPGLVLRWLDKSLEVLHEEQDQVVVRVGGGWPWDEWVALTVARNWAGLECLSGIPGMVGAAPIQNIGAYGQEVAHCIEACWVMSLQDGRSLRLDKADCAFGYRDSRFKRDWKGRYLVTAVEFRLLAGGRPRLAYAELQQRFAAEEHPSLPRVREEVLAIRRSKSMVWDPQDPNHRSAGSFFVNPLVSASVFEALQQQHPKVPYWPAGTSVKLSAAWLIENAGFPKGYQRGAAGLSSRHVLALINRGGAQARELLDLAQEIRQGVAQRFGIWLQPEPEMVGFSLALS